MRKFITGAIIVPLMCLTICARDFDLNGISALNISGSGDNTNIQPPRVLALNNINDAYDFPVKPGTAWALTKTDPLLLIRSEPVLVAGFSVGGGATTQAASRMAGFSARACRPSFGARRLTASFGNTIVRHF